ARLGILRDLLRSTHPHQVTRPVRGKLLKREFNNVASKRARFANAKPANGISEKADVDGAQSRFAAKLGIHTTLDDAKQRGGRLRSRRGGRIRPPDGAKLRRPSFSKIRAC